MDRGQADIFIADFARQLGLADVALDEEGMGILALAGPVIVGIGHNAGRGSLDLMTCLVDVEPSPARSLAALRGNLEGEKPGGETLAMDPASGAFVLQRRYFGGDLADGGLAAAIQGLVDQASLWTRRLTALGGPAGAADPTPATIAPRPQTFA